MKMHFKIITPEPQLSTFRPKATLVNYLLGTSSLAGFPVGWDILECVVAVVIVVWASEVAVVLRQEHGYTVYELVKILTVAAGCKLFLGD